MARDDERSGAHSEKPSPELVAAMKHCLPPHSGFAKKSASIVLGSNLFHVTVDNLPWFSGVSAADILSAVTAGDASCFTAAQRQELRKFVAELETEMERTRMVKTQILGWKQQITL